MQFAAAVRARLGVPMGEALRADGVTRALWWAGIEIEDEAAAAAEAARVVS